MRREEGFRRSPLCTAARSQHDIDEVTTGRREITLHDGAVMSRRDHGNTTTWDSPPKMTGQIFLKRYSYMLRRGCDKMEVSTGHGDVAIGSRGVGIDPRRLRAAPAGMEGGA